MIQTKNKHFKGTTNLRKSVALSGISALNIPAIKCFSIFESEQAGDSTD